MSGEHVPAVLQRRVRERAAMRCEYCGIAQEHQEATFHIDHVVPRRAGGETILDNLALACVSCSLRKGRP
jgi:5-methylcytosine-specific restriction endonuclease McrA